MGMKELIIAFIFAGLFFFALTTFAFKFAEDNSLNSSIIDNQIINRSYAQIEQNLTRSEGTASGQRTVLESEPPEAEKYNPIVSIFSVLIGIGSMIFGFYNTITSLLREVLGIPTIVIGTFTAILIITISLLIWRAWKAGS